MKIKILPVLSDNYTYIFDTGKNATAVVDPGESGPIISYLEKNDLQLHYILNTHHHADHTGGNLKLKEKYDCTIYGPMEDKNPIPELDHIVTDNDVIQLGDCEISVISTPGHTLGGVCYYSSACHALFSGDTLFSMGCGRLFEGNAEMLYHSLQKILRLPDETQIYCGHEYTLNGAKFCLSIEPHNNEIIAREREAIQLRLEGKPTVPVLLSVEKKTNVFLRACNVSELAHLRQLRNQF